MLSSDVGIRGDAFAIDFHGTTNLSITNPGATGDSNGEPLLKCLFPNTNSVSFKLQTLSVYRRNEDIAGTPIIGCVWRETNERRVVEVCSCDFSLETDESVVIVFVFCPRTADVVITGLTAFNCQLIYSRILRNNQAALSLCLPRDMTFVLTE